MSFIKNLVTKSNGNPKNFNKDVEDIEEKYKIDFLVIFHQDGLPIYSKCVSDICKIFIKDEVLLSGFLSAITSFPQTLGLTADSISSMDLGNSKLFFSYGKHKEVFVVGVKKDTYSEKVNHLVNLSIESIKLVFDKIAPSEIDWGRASPELIKQLEKGIEEEVLNAWFSKTGTHNTCPAEESCPFTVSSLQGRRKRISIFKSFRSIYDSIRTKFSTQV